MRRINAAGFGTALIAGTWLLAASAMAHHLKGDPANGRKLAAQACQTCHGVDGVSRLPNAPTIAGESEVYLTKQLNAFRSGQRKDEMMAIVVKSLNNQKIADLAAWYASIKVTVTLPGEDPPPASPTPTPPSP